jgi:uncharacterized protein with HEPN domain
VKEDRTYLLHIRDAVAQLQTYADDGKRNFLADRKTQEATIRNFEVLGEAVKNLSPGLKVRHPDIPWKAIAGMRDKLIHDYFGVNPELIWDVLEMQIPALGVAIDKMLAEVE